MPALPFKRTAAAEGADIISEVTVHHSDNSGAGWVYKVWKNEKLYASLAGASQTECDDAIETATMAAMTPGP